MERKPARTVCARVGTIVLVTLMVITALTGCNTAARNDELATVKRKNEALKQRIEMLEDNAENLQRSLLGAAVNALTLIANQDFASLSTVVHPVQGVRFSPYAYVEVENHIKFSAQDIAGLPSNNTVYTWGAYDGSGDPIELSFADYYKRFVYDQEFIDPHIVGLNRVIGMGNTIVNIADAYPNASFVEFHFTGFDPQYEGMDWRSLFLVFEELNGKWFLVGIAHNEWTI